MRFTSFTGSSRSRISRPASIRNKILVAKVAVLICILLVIEAADRRFDMEALLLKSTVVPRGRPSPRCCG